MSQPSGCPGRALGVDLGSRRIGVAVSDDRRRVATTLTVLTRGASQAEDHAKLAGLVGEVGAKVVVVGLPLSLSGGRGPAAMVVDSELAGLRQVLDVPVVASDERYTTRIARRVLASGGRKRALRREVVDHMAAAAILQTWLDRERARTTGALP
ncbi:MAG: Holliday junction resolvase RuvX [Acidimicrobiales bacterium]